MSLRPGIVSLHTGDYSFHAFVEHLVGVDIVLGPEGTTGSTLKVNLISFFLLHSISASEQAPLNSTWIIAMSFKWAPGFILSHSICHVNMLTQS